jgi:hypothetical protein
MTATSWQQAIEQERRFEDFPVVMNDENLYSTIRPGRGQIELCADGEHFDVTNTCSQEKRVGVATDQVEQALVDLGIANSDWF